MIFTTKKSLYQIVNNLDKSVHRWEHYFNAYEKHFSKFRNKKVNVLEIGVQNGGSLLMWKKYFGKKSKIFGVDIDENCIQHANKKENIEVIIGDAGNLSFLQSLLEKLPHIDIVIDDGGHFYNDQVQAFNFLYPHLNNNGVYLVEDIHCSLWNNDKENFLDFTHKIANELMAYHKDLARFSYLSLPREKREYEIEVPLLTKTVDCISIYDSMVVFDKKAKLPPFSNRYSTK